LLGDASRRSAFRFRHASTLDVGRAKKDGAPLSLEISTFGKQATACKQHLAKGRRVGANGSLDVREYRARDGNSKTVVAIRANQMDFLSGNQKPATTQTPETEQDDIAF